jgi:hypothetical protein
MRKLRTKLFERQAILPRLKDVLVLTWVPEIVFSSHKQMLQYFLKHTAILSYEVENVSKQARINRHVNLNSICAKGILIQILVFCVATPYSLAGGCQPFLASLFSPYYYDDGGRRF